jgi:hypothetical protein
VASRNPSHGPEDRRYHNHYDDGHAPERHGRFAGISALRWHETIERSYGAEGKRLGCGGVLTDAERLGGGAATPSPLVPRVLSV